MYNQNRSPRIFAACKASVFFGVEHGVWLDATMDLEDLAGQIDNMLVETLIPEVEPDFIILKTEGFGVLEIARDECLGEVRGMALFIQEHGEAGADLIQRYGSLQKAKDHVRKS